eukprot:TRINITY_DN497_c0_g1_i1.p1 TRINITY_DN497_c0_g1~~TRINITY_DN497_c0_g1_i1.p1  ORF type:complete len:239 (-),score=34.80 TRINITY_DN497_c0_g1_i1:7-669(-)
MLTIVPLTVWFIAAAYISSKSRIEPYAVFWYIFSGVVHILMEGSYLVHHSEIRQISSIPFAEKMREEVPFYKFFDSRFYAGLYEQYAKYDARYSMSEPMVVFFCWTELVEGILCFVLVYLIEKRSLYRHPLQIVCATAQAYGAVFYFLTPVIYGNWATTITKDTYEFVVYVLLLNGIWCLVPILLIIQSFETLVHPKPSNILSLTPTICDTFVSNEDKNK